MADPRYIADHLVRIATEHRDSSYAKLDSFRRIASNADILEIDEELTPPKALEVKQFCSDFIASDEGKQALVEQKAARFLGYRGQDNGDLKQSFQSQMEAAGVPTNQAAAAADALARQSQGELPVPLPEGSQELEAVLSAYTWFCAKQHQ